MMDGGGEQRSREYGVSLSLIRLWRYTDSTLWRSLAPGKVLRVSGPPSCNLAPSKWGRPVHLCFGQLVDAMVTPLDVIGKGLRDADTIDFKA